MPERADEPRTIRAAACQLHLEVGRAEANRARATAAIEEAVASGARLVVLPELVNSGYVFTGPDESRGLAEPVDGPTVSGWCRLAARYEIVIVGGWCELDDEDQVRNSSVIVDHTGVRAVYRKVHLWHEEVDSFLPGDQAPPVVETAAGRIATMVCYDLEFPEWVRVAALAGADVLAVPTNWPREPGAGRFPLEVVLAQAGASVNRMAVVAADRCGPERGVEWVGGSSIIGADGQLVAGPMTRARPAVLIADLDLTLARNKSIGPRNDVMADRRPELYGPVAR
jgi:predicted amidohydrolase